MDPGINQTTTGIVALASGTAIYFSLMAAFRGLDRRIPARIQALKGDLRPGAGRKTGNLRSEVAAEGKRLLAGGILAGAALGFLTGGPLLAAAGAGLGGLISGRLTARRRTDRLLRVKSELEPALPTMSICVKSGLSIPQALEMAVREIGPTLGPELEHCLREYQAGIPLPEALDRAGRRTGCGGLEDLALLLQLHGKYGGNLAGSLSGLAEGLRRERLVQADLAAKTTESRNAALTLALMPVVLAVYLVKYQTELVEPLWQEPTGRIVLAAAAGFWTAGTWLVNRFLSSEELTL